MASSLPYVASNKNLATLFSKIASAKVPDKFTHSFLQQTLTALRAEADAGR
jgi:hypothetical protein